MANSTVFQKKDILAILTAKGLIEAEKADFLRKKIKNNVSLAETLIAKKIVSEENLAKASAEFLNIPFVRIQGKKLSQEILEIIPLELANKLKLVAFEKIGDRVNVAIGQAYRLSAGGKHGPLHNLEKEKKIKLELYAAPQSDIDWALAAYQNLSAGEVTEKPARTIKISDLPQINLEQENISFDIVRKFPKDIIAKYQIVLFEITTDNIFKIAMVDPFDGRAREILEFISQKNQVKIEKYQIGLENLRWVLDNYDQPSAPAPVAASTSQPPPKTALSSRFKIKQGVYYLDEKDISVPTSASAEKPLTSQSGDNQETNLDVFLGKMVATKEELVTIITAGFIPKIVAGILSLGVKIRASDIHFESGKDYFRLRYRVDGDLQDFVYMPIKLQPPVISRIKILSGLKIDEQRVPQDGRYNLIAQKHDIDVRVSSFPTVHGEKVVMRLLDKTTSQYSLKELGFAGRSLSAVEGEIKKPWGVIIVTGPTGSGKTTTLYAVLNAISSPKINIITLEDPVEYDIAGINQAQVKPKIGFSFAEGLRSVLRQDPNVIMVGEVRDSETANLVTHAALTGHLVLTTLHTNDAASALPRLTNMKVEPYLITSSINAIVAQRLIRRLCLICRQKISIPEAILKREVPEKDHQAVFYGPGKGCKECHNGYKGRMGIFEVLVMTDEIEQLAINRAPASKIDEMAKKQGMISMKQDGIAKATQGFITLEDVIQATSE